MLTYSSFFSSLSAALEVASLDQEDDRLKRLMMEEEKDIFDYNPPRLMVEKSVDGSYQRYALSTLQQLRVLLRRTTSCTMRETVSEGNWSQGLFYRYFVIYRYYLPMFIPNFKIPFVVRCQLI